MFFRRVKKKSRRLFLLLLVCLVLWCWYRWQTKYVPSRMPAMQTVNAVQTDNTVCAVTLSVTGIESRASLELLASVCKGMQVRPCIFVSTDWLYDNPELLPSLSFADLGLLYERPPSKWTKKQTMLSVASQNERFMAMTGMFPHYVRFAKGEPDGFVSDALQSYGQICIGFEAMLADALSAGNIIDLGLLDGTTAYSLAEFYASAVAGGYAVLPLPQLLNATNA